MHRIKLIDSSRIAQPPMRVAPEVEEWLAKWVQDQLSIGLLKQVDPYEDLPVLTGLLAIKGT